MATTTPNFGWTVPTSTDLVKDGATAIETLGDSIDGSFVDLKGGTTGQVLAKASATDLDFSWIAVDPLTILDAKGDLISATAPDTPARLPVGTNGQILAADSTASTGLKWVTPAGGGKVLQVVQSVYTTQTTVASTTYADTGLTATITPSSATSKVLVIVNQNSESFREQDNNGIHVRVLRGATTLLTIANALFTYHIGGTSIIGANVNYTYLDSPATTSATTYKTQGKADSAANNGRAVFQSSSNPSMITLLEIGA
jgi:hypothetical protein